jgi:L-threonylcarbamoyladenylate synthase
MIKKNFSSEIKELVLKGGIGVIPTDTIYGVVGSAFSKKTVERIYKLKEREKEKPFIILIADRTDLLKFGVKLNKEQDSFLDAQWSLGKPISVVLPFRSKRFEYLHRGTNSLAFRLVRPVALRNFVRAVGPLVAPSANPAGLTPSKNIEEAFKYFADGVDFYVDHGNVVGKPSSLVRINEDQSIEVLRK